MFARTSVGVLLPRQRLNCWRGDTAGRDILPSLLLSPHVSVTRACLSYHSRANLFPQTLVPESTVPASVATPDRISLCHEPLSALRTLLLRASNPAIAADRTIPLLFGESFRTTEKHSEGAKCLNCGGSA